MKMRQIKTHPNIIKYKTKEFIDYLGQIPGSYHIYVRIDKTRDKYDQVLGIPATSMKFPKNLDGKAQIYISVNPCRMMTGKPKISDVTHWTCEYIDLDVERPDHTVPATDEELARLKSDINDINNWLGMNGIMNGYFDMTGNGYRWLLPVSPLDLRNMDIKDVMKLNEQKKEFLRIMKRETGANIDTSVGELSRITGIPGTMNVKARDDTDRRREPFRGCNRLEDQNLQDYIMGIEIEETEYIPESVDWGTDTGLALDVIMSLDLPLKTMIERVGFLRPGKRSEYDYAIALKLRNWKVSISDAMDILHQFGSSKARKRMEYVKITVLGAYTDVKIK
jgi:hypothetical protein